MLERPRSLRASAWLGIGAPSTQQPVMAARSAPEAGLSVASSAGALPQEVGCSVLDVAVPCSSCVAPSTAGADEVMHHHQQSASSFAVLPLLFFTRAQANKLLLFSSSPAMSEESTPITITKSALFPCACGPVLSAPLTCALPEGCTLSRLCSCPILPSFDVYCLSSVAAPEKLIVLPSHLVSYQR